MTTKPRGHINTGERARLARECLGLSQAALARVMRLKYDRTVGRIEKGETKMSGPYQLALEAMLSGWRPWGVKLPIDKRTSK